jgi:ribose/xylose/arabinose/galactoside ABC-type transport system permease subunit
LNEITKQIVIKKETILLNYALTIFLACVFIIASIIHSSFFELNNLINILQYISITGVFALGLTLVLIIGEIDISVASIAVFSAVAGGAFIEPTRSAVIVISVTFAAGIFLGLINGLAIRFLHIPSFIMTLAMYIIGRAGAIGISGGLIQFPRLIPAYLQIGQARPGGVPSLVIIFASVSIIFFMLLRFTSVGKLLYLIGSNPKAAKYSGIRVNFWKIIVFVISGFLSALAGIMASAQIGQIDPQQTAQGYELTAISIAILGGASLIGGRGTIQGTIQAAAIIGMLTNVMNLFAISAYFQRIVTGAILILVVCFDFYWRRRGGERSE